jgi:hypothetical protein
MYRCLPTVSHTRARSGGGLVQFRSVGFRAAENGTKVPVYDDEQQHSNVPTATELLLLRQVIPSQLSWFYSACMQSSCVIRVSLQIAAALRKG